MAKVSRLLVVLGIVLSFSVAVIAAEEETAKGRIKSITTEKKELTMLLDESDKSLTILVSNTTKISVNDKEDQKLSDLRQNDQVTVKYKRENDRNNASEIKAKRQPRR